MLQRPPKRHMTSSKSRTDKPDNEQTAPRFALGTTYGGRDALLLERMLPHVDYIEVTPDTIAENRNGKIILHQQTLDELHSIGSNAKIIVHGIGLSIGSHDGYSEIYLRMLDTLLEQIDVAWHSEHLGYTMVDGEFLGAMLTLPRTEPVLDMICERVVSIQRRYALPFFLENVVNLLPECESDYSPAAFLNEVAERTGCGLILDAYNLECDAHNHSLDIREFLEELNPIHVREIHLANGVKYEGLMLDVHSQITKESTIVLARQIISQGRGSVMAVTYELLPEAVPVVGHDAIVSELARLSSCLVR